MNKSIYDLLTSIDYAYCRKKTYIDIPQTRSAIFLCELLKKEGYIRSFIFKNHQCSNFYDTLYSDLKNINMRIFLNYDKKLVNKFLLKHKPFYKLSKAKPYNNLKIISKPSRQITMSLWDIQRSFHNYKFNIVYIFSTDRGYITGLDCLKYNIGGVLICYFI